MVVAIDQGLKLQDLQRLKDPAADDPRILDLRRLHEDMDRAVLAAYGWPGIPVPPYCPLTDADRAALQAFEDDVIDRLYVLNAERAREEQRLGLGAKKRARPVGGDDADAPPENAAPPPAPAKAGRGKKKQGSLF